MTDKQFIRKATKLTKDRMERIVEKAVAKFRSGAVNAGDYSELTLVDLLVSSAMADVAAYDEASLKHRGYSKDVKNLKNF